MDVEMIIEKAIKGEISTGLIDTLPRLTRDRLYSIARIYNIPGRSKMNKATLVEKVLEYITDIDHVGNILLIAREEEIDLLKRLLDSSYIQDDKIHIGECEYLMERGLIFSFLYKNKLYFAVPDEVKNLCGGLDTKSFNRRYERYQNVLRYILALTNLYGAFCPKLLIDIFNMQNTDILDMREFKTIYSRLVTRRQIFSMRGDIIISEYFNDSEDSDELEEFLEAIQDKPHYIPRKEELLRYSEVDYFEWTPQLEALEDFILKYMCSDKEITEGLIDDIQLMCSMEADLQDILNVFERRYIYIRDERQARILMPLIIDVYNNTRIWRNCGHTASEITKISSPHSNHNTQQRRVHKVGRNDPCPCGSGRKYKKCCGGIQ